MYRLRNQIGPSENSQSIIFCKRTLWYAQRCPRAIRRESPFCNEHLVTKKDPFRLLKRVGLYILLALLFLIHSTSCISYQVPSDHSNLKVGPSSASDLKLYCDDGARYLTTENGETWCKSTVDEKRYAEAVIHARTTKQKGDAPSAWNVLGLITLGLWPIINDDVVQTEIKVLDRNGKIRDEGVYRSSSTEILSWFVIPVWFVVPFSDGLRAGTNNPKARGIWGAHRMLIQPALPEVARLEALQTVQDELAERLSADRDRWRLLKNSSVTLADLYAAQEQFEIELFQKRVQFVIRLVIDKYAGIYAERNMRLNPDWPVVFSGNREWGELKYLFTGFALKESSPATRSWEVIEGRQCFRRRLYTGSHCLRWVEPDGKTFFLVLVPDGERYLIPAAGVNGVPYRRQMRINISTLLAYLNSYPEPDKQSNPEVLKLPVPGHFFELAEQKISEN